MSVAFWRVDPRTYSSASTVEERPNREAEKSRDIRIPDKDFRMVLSFWD
jgi:hypothetical protein